MTAKKILALPSGFQLAPTLAQRIRQLREYRNLTVKDLARAANFSFERVEDLEGGMETWLSSTDRQKLARALAIEPAVIEEVEKRPQKDLIEDFQPQMEDISAAILAGQRNLSCPRCRQPLISSIQDGLDLEGQPIRFAKAYCTRCPFVLR